MMFSFTYYDIFTKETKNISIVNGLFSDEHLEKRFDFSKWLVSPAFVDAHAHPIGMVLKYNWVDLYDVSSKRSLLDLIKDFTDLKKPYFIGYNFDESKWRDDSTYPNRKELDDVAKDIPVLLLRIDGHMAVVNTKTIRELHLDGSIMGNLNEGYIYEENVYVAIEKFVEKFEVPYGYRAIDEFLENGITAVCDMALGGPIPPGVKDRISRKIEIYYYDTLEKLEKLSMDQVTNILIRYKAKNIGLKLFVDGSIGARTAYLSEPYRDDPSNRGILLIEKDLLEELIKCANRARVQMAIHAIGDMAIDNTVNALRYADPQLRHRIEHFEMPHDDNIKTISRYGIIPSMQPNFIANWQQRGGLYEKRLGWDRAKNMNPLKSILDSTKIIAFGSDCMPVGPLYGIYGAMTHPVDAERLSLEEAILCYTCGAAYSIFREKIMGKIEPGFEASFIVIDLKPSDITPKKIKDGKIIAFYRKGEQVFARKSILNP